MSDSDDPRDDMHWDEDDEEYSDLGIDWEDAKEMGYEDDRDNDDERFKGSSNTGSSYSGGGQGCLVVMCLSGTVLGAIFAFVKNFL